MLLALATISSAWCVYQANRWSGTQTVDFSNAAGLRQESIRAENIANTQTQIDVQVFLEWVNARATNNTVLADFIQARFRPEFLPAFDAWISMINTTPGTSIPPGTPFSLPEYKLENRTKSEELSNSSQAYFAQAKIANQIGDDFILTTVLFASVLFLSSIQSRFDSPQLRSILLLVALGIFSMAFVILLILPVNVGF